MTFILRTALNSKFSTMYVTRSSNLPSKFFLSFPDNHVAEKELRELILNNFNSTAATTDKLDFVFRRFWHAINASETLKAHLVHYALFWTGADRWVEFFYRYYEMYKPNLELEIDNTNNRHTYSYKKTNLQYAISRLATHIEHAALLLAHDAQVDNINLSPEQANVLNPILNDLKTMPRDEYLKKYNITKPVDRHPKNELASGFNFNGLIPDVQLLILNRVIDHFDWLRLVCKSWNALTKTLLGTSIPRVPEKCIGKHSMSIDITVFGVPFTNVISLEIYETDYLTMQSYHSRLDRASPSMTWNKMEGQCGEFWEIESFPKDEFLAFMRKHYQNYNALYSQTWTSNMNNSEESWEEQTSVFIEKTAGFGIFFIGNSDYTRVDGK